MKPLEVIYKLLELCGLETDKYFINRGIILEDPNKAKILIRMAAHNAQY